MLTQPHSDCDSDVRGCRLARAGVVGGGIWVDVDVGVARVAAMVMLPALATSVFLAADEAGEWGESGGDGGGGLPSSEGS
jgi:hypothetical protein